MNRLPPDAGTVCAALELDAGYLADLFRKEAGRVLNEVAELIDADAPVKPLREGQLEHATHLLLIAEGFEDEWERQEGKSDEAMGRNGSDSQRLHRPSQEGIVAPDSAAGA